MTNSATNVSGGDWRPEDVMVTDPKIVKRAIGAAAIGNVTEWYDFGVYAYLATTIDGVFFNGLPENLRLVATFGVFTTAFLVRPLGGLFFGPLADKIGRKQVLSITMILMAAATFAIGFIPSYDAIGIAAPILLLLARLIQGFSTGGEYGTAMTFIAEYSSDRKRGFMGSWLEFGTFTGYTMAAVFYYILHSTLTDAQMHDFGWRIPFFIALPLGSVGVYLRLKLEDTPAFRALEEEADQREKEQREQNKGGLRRIFVDNWPAMLICVALVATWNITNYMLTAYIPSYVTDELSNNGKPTISDSASELSQIAVLIIALIAVTFVGRLADRIGRKPLVLVGSLSLLLLSFPSVLLIQSGTVPSVFLGLLIMGLTLILFSGNMPSTLPAVFPTVVRAGALSIAFNISVSLFGGTTQTVMSGLVAATGDVNWPAYYLVACGVLGLIAWFFMKETARRPLMGSPPAAESDEEAREVVGAGR